MLAAEPAFMPPAAAIRHEARPPLAARGKHRPGGPLQDFGKTAGTREKYAQTDQKPAAIRARLTQASPKRENMGDDKQARELEGGLEIELQGGTCLT